jgi:putative flippase GtrA
MGRDCVMRISAAATTPDASLRALLDVLPRPIRFLGVGGVGLFTDLTIFTLLLSHVPHPLLARLVSLAAATLVTWRLNRALTFARTGRGLADEAARYAVVAGCAQAVSYSIFAALIVMNPAMVGVTMPPQLAVLAGAAAGAAVSYAGQLYFAFRPRRPALGAQ